MFEHYWPSFTRNQGFIVVFAFSLTTTSIFSEKQKSKNQHLYSACFRFFWGEITLTWIIWCNFFMNINCFLILLNSIKKYRYWTIFKHKQIFSNYFSTIIFIFILYTSCRTFNFVPTPHSNQHRRLSMR